MAFKGVATSDPTLDKIQMTGPFYANAVSGLVALAGGGQAGATGLTGDINVIATVATAADSVQLPQAMAGREISVTNTSANSMNVFPFVGDKINALSVNAAFAVAAGKTCSFFSAASGQWYSLLSA